MKPTDVRQLQQAIPEAPSPFFASGGRQHALNEIEQVLAQPGRHVLVCGVAGAGKTTLLGELTRRLGDGIIRCRLDGGEITDSALLIRRLAQAAGEALVESSGIGELLVAFDHLALLGRSVLLVCDDAQQLPLEVLETLSALAQGSSVHLLLTADSGGAASLSAAGVDISFTRVDLAPLERQALERYIYFRLSCWGRDHVVLSAAAIDAIDAASGGALGAVDEQIVQVVSAEQHLSVPENPQFPRCHVIAAALLGALVMGLWLFWPSPVSKSGDSNYVTRSLPLPVPQPLAEMSAMLPRVPTGAASDTERSAAVPAAAPERTMANRVSEPSPAAPVSTAAGVRVAGSGSKPAARSARRAGSTLRYAIQLTGTRSRAAAVQFVSTLGHLPEARYRETTLHGKPWYVVLSGRYSSMSQARTALERLPARLRKLKPWSRQIPPEP